MHRALCGWFVGWCGWLVPESARAYRHRHHPAIMPQQQTYEKTASPPTRAVPDDTKNERFLILHIIQAGGGGITR